MAHRNLANGAKQRSKAKWVFFGVPAVVKVPIRINDYKSNAAGDSQRHTGELNGLFAGYDPIDGTPQSEIVGKSAIDQMDEVPMPVHVGASLRSDVSHARRGRRVVQYGLYPFRLGLRLLRRMVFQS